MKDLLSLLAKYNKLVNKDLFGLLEKQDKSILTEESGSYFGTVTGLLNHILVADLGWLSAYRDSPVELPALHSPALEFEHPGWGANFYDEFLPLQKHREQIDDLFIALIDSVDDKLLQSDITLTRSNGRSHTFPFGKILLHLFNHQTHHRGAVSQILDARGVENDFSNLMRLLMK